MKILKNNFDTEVTFTDLQEAKNWYLPKENIPCTKEEYCERFSEYKEEIEQSETLEELADVLSRYTEDFDNGSEYKVVEV